MTAVLRPLAFLDDMEGDEISEERATLAAWRGRAEEALGALSCVSPVENYPEWAYWVGRDIFAKRSTLCSEPDFAKVWNAVLLTPSCRLGDAFPGGGICVSGGGNRLEPTDTLVLESPFPLREQMEVWVISTGMAVPDPGLHKGWRKSSKSLWNRTGGVLLSFSRRCGLLRTGWRAASPPERGDTTFPFRKPAEGGIAASIQGRPCIRPGGSVSFREELTSWSGLTQVIIDSHSFPSSE